MEFNNALMGYPLAQSMNNFQSKAIQRCIEQLIPRHKKGFEGHERNPQRMWQRGIA